MTSLSEFDTGIIMTSEFSKAQIESAYPDGMENHYWHLARNQIIESVLRQFNLDQERILDVGCGRGSTVLHLQKKGIQCFGVDLGEFSPLEAARPFIQTGINAVDLDLKDRKEFKCLLLLDVIEHVENPALLLNNLKSNFPNLKTILLAVPARTELWSNFDEHYGHYRRYDFKSLNNLANQLGWKIKFLSYFFRFLYLPLFIFSKLKKEREIKFSPPSKIESSFHKFLGKIFLCEYRILPQSIIGTSIISLFSFD